MDRYAIVSFLPKNMETSLDQIREHFEPGVSLIIPAHISLSFPFFITTEIDEIITNVLNLAKTTKATSVRITGIETFNTDSENKVIYAQISPKETLEELHISINGLLKNVSFDTSAFPEGHLPLFIPHITLAMKTDPRNVEWIKSKFAFLFNTKIEINQIHLINQKMTNGVWLVDHSFPLEGFV